jgi:hypothetical protein
MRYDIIHQALFTDGVHCMPPYNWIGDQLFVKESWAVDHPDVEVVKKGLVFGEEFYGPFFKASETAHSALKWQSPASMPRWVARTVLEITDVFVEKEEDKNRWVWVYRFKKIRDQ